jgi:hypothetical protein
MRKVREAAARVQCFGEAEGRDSPDFASIAPGLRVLLGADYDHRCRPGPFLGGMVGLGVPPGRLEQVWWMP